MGRLHDDLVDKQMTDWIPEAQADISAWLAETGADTHTVDRVREGLELSRTGEMEAYVQPGQAPNLLVPGLTAKPWWDPAGFAWVGGLEAQADMILGEVVASGGIRNSGARNEFTTTGRWTIHYLTCVGRPDRRSARSFPQTWAALSAVPGALSAGMAFFSAVDGKTHICTHTGFTNAHLRCHLSLVTNDASVIRVAETMRSWTRGEVMIFDDSYDHEVWNDSDEARLVLLFDIYHPELTHAERSALDIAFARFRKHWMRRAMRGIAQAA